MILGYAQVARLMGYFPGIPVYNLPAVQRIDGEFMVAESHALPRDKGAWAESLRDLFVDDTTGTAKARVALYDGPRVDNEEQACVRIFRW